jgi:hypothetical protein
MDFFDVVTTQRAIRRLKPEPIPDAVLREIMNAAICAPSTDGAQLTLTTGASIHPAGQNIMLAARARIQPAPNIAAPDSVEARQVLDCLETPTRRANR